MAEVVFEHVTKRYGAITVIDDLNLEIRDHEMMVLVGPSGCGKSTALRMIAGLEEISSGTISIGGVTVNDLPPRDRDIAMVFQTYALYPHMTVRENLEFALKMRRTDRSERETRVREAAEILGLSTLLERKPKELSGGQRQRVALGRAIVRKPAVFLFDEPLSNLDAKLRVQMRGEIARIQQTFATTSVYVTHDQVEAMTMGHRIAVMSGGKIAQVGTPLDVYEKPENLFVAQFVGTSPMSFVRGRIDKGFLRAQGIDISLPQNISLASGREVIAGIRPDHVHAAGADARAGSSSLSAVVELVEQLGHEVVVHARAGETIITGTFDAHVRPAIGETIQLQIEVDKLHLFDATTERRLP